MEQFHINSLVHYEPETGLFYKKADKDRRRIGYYSKLEHLIRALINHEIRTGEAKTP